MDYGLWIMDYGLSFVVYGSWFLVRCVWLMVEGLGGYWERRQDKTSGGASTHLRVRYRLCPSDRGRVSRH